MKATARAHRALTKRERASWTCSTGSAAPRRARSSTQLPGAPTNSTVRTQLRVLEGKGHVRHEEHGLRYIYMPTVPRHSARRSALKHLVETFFDGSSAKVVAALLGGEGSRLSDDDLKRIAEMVDTARGGTR